MATMEAEEQTMSIEEMEFAQTNYETHPEGIWRAKLTEVNPCKVNYQGGPEQNGIEFVFVTEARNSKGELFEVRRKSGLSWGPKSKVFRPFLIAMGVDVSNRQVVTGKEVKELIGKGLRLHIVHSPRKDGPGVFDAINAFLPLKDARPKQAEKPTVKPSFDDDEGDPFADE